MAQEENTSYRGDQDSKESWETELSIIAEFDVFGTYHLMPQRLKQRSALGV